MTYNLVQSNISIECLHHQHLQFAARPVIEAKALEHLVKLLANKSPESVDWAIISNLCRNVRRKMEIWLHGIFPIYLNQKDIVI